MSILGGRPCPCSTSSPGSSWNLDKTVVRAPTDGYVTNLALRKGARVANLPLSPVMAFIDTSDTILGVEIAQIDARYIEPGQDVEVTFKYMPGHVYTGKVAAVLQAVASGQVQTSGLAVAPSKVESVPFGVRVVLDDKEFAKRLPPAAPGRQRSSPAISRSLTSSARSCYGKSPS